ncbi:MAG: hypothetical protein JSR91_14055 [Proteobacteria bacterium]|nr:hypothetical protein [Pseudomonadota bacterium]
MLRDDTSPGKERIETIAEKAVDLVQGMRQHAGEHAREKEDPLVPQATVVKSGVVRVMEAQEQGWRRLRP